jgi:hypothetical protein
LGRKEGYQGDAKWRSFGAETRGKEGAISGLRGRREHKQSQNPYLFSFGSFEKPHFSQNLGEVAPWVHCCSEMGNFPKKILQGLVRVTESS